MDKHLNYRTRRTILRVVIAVIALWLIPIIAEAQETFSYSYGDPSTPLNDGYIVSTSNAVVSSEAPYRYWKPNVGGTTEGNTTPAEIVFHFPLIAPSASIDLSMSMPTFHWSYSRGHNLLYGSTDGSNWEQLADVLPPAFGTFNDLGAVAIPETLLGAEEFWLKAELFSFGSSAPSGGVWTNTAQLSRYDINTQNTTFSLNVTSVPEPSGITLLALTGLAAAVRRRR